MKNLEELAGNRFAGKRIVLLGFGREGQSSYLFLRKLFPEKEIALADLRPEIRESPVLQGDDRLRFITGEGYLQQLQEFDVVFRSPGIPVWTLTDRAHDGSLSPEKITSQTALFLECYSEQVIGVTGTKGKSTTASLIHHILQTAERNTMLAGNIGNPVFHIAPLVNPSSTVVLELSSHQLEYLVKAPSTAILLNLFQEHLDAYKDFESYQLAKVNITRFQQPGDRLIWNDDDERVREKLSPYVASRRCYPFSLLKKPPAGGYLAEGFVCFAGDGQVSPVWKVHQDRFLRGEHNLKNILAAVNAAMVHGVGTDVIAEGIATFRGLEHRLEYVGEFGGIHFYNDSIATIPEACIEAIRAVPDVDTLVAGGFDRGIGYDALAGFLARSAVRNIILVGAAGRRIGECLDRIGHTGQTLFRVDRFDEFRVIAFRVTRRGSACLLSPAAASYDEFNNFEERGKRYRELVRSYNP